MIKKEKKGMIDGLLVLFHPCVCGGYNEEGGYVIVADV